MKIRCIFLSLLFIVLFNITVFASTKYRVVVPEQYNTIMVGDSRTVGVSKTVSDNNIAYICEVGQGYSWLNNKAQYDLIKLAKPNCNIVFNLGVNDIGNKYNYVSLMNNLSAVLSNKGCNVYYESVNPVSNNYNHPTNTQIDDFNNYMYENLIGYNIIDSNTVLKLYGYNTVDGLHYDSSTTKRTFDYVKDKLV